MTRWIWVSLTYATFALGAQDGRITEAAPIARWALGKPERDAAAYYRRKGARFAILTGCGTRLDLDRQSNA